MTILSSQTIERVRPLAPLLPRTRHRGLTYGLGPAGYDIRVAERFLVWPGRTVPASSLEYFQMPGDVLGVVHDKSTWARIFLLVQNTVIEPGWFGHLTLELTKSGFRRPKRNWVERWLLRWWPVFWVHEGTGIAQVLFHQLDEPTAQPYEGKYQDQQAGPVEPIFEAGFTCPDPSGCPTARRCLASGACLR